MSDVNLEELSVEQLRELALKEMASPAPEAEPEGEEKPRDDKGRFVKKEEAEPEAVEEPEVFERVIDLGDGAGAQVFRGKTLEELVDNLAKAQEHATRKIRELATEAKRVKEKPVEEKKPEPELSPEERYVLEQRAQTDPIGFMRELAKKEAERIAAEERAQRQREEQLNEQLRLDSEKFVKDTPEYYVSEKNGKRIVKWLEVEGLAGTYDNIRKAYEDLSESGLLEVRPEEQQQSAEEGEEVETARIERKADATVTKRKVVGGSMSGKRSAPAPKTLEPTEEDLYKMPLAELEALTLKSIVGNK